MKNLPNDIQDMIVSYLSFQELFSIHYLFQSDMIIKYLKFPLESKYNEIFYKWIYRWKHKLVGLESICIKYLDEKYRSCIFEIFGTINFKNIKELYIINILGLFDSLSPQLLFALRNFFYKCHDTVRTYHIDARLFNFCSNKKKPEYIIYTQRGTRTYFYKNNEWYQDSRKTTFYGNIWINNIDVSITIKCCCYNDICDTRLYIPNDNVRIIH